MATSARRLGPAAPARGQELGSGLEIRTPCRRSSAATGDEATRGGDLVPPDDPRKEDEEEENLGMPEDRPTSVPCPVPGCEGGMRITRTEDQRGGYRVLSERCAFCGGTGAVTPAKQAAYRRLMRGIPR